MNITFYRADKQREVDLANAFKEGVESVGDTCTVISSSLYKSPLTETDIAVVVGVKGISRKCIDEHWAQGKKIIYLDKGFIRLRSKRGGTLHVKMSYNNFQPLSYFMKNKMPETRWQLLKKEAREQGYDLTPRPFRNGDVVMLSGPSEKYATFHNLHSGGATGYCKEVVAKLKHNTDRQIVYWPKQSWKDALPIEGSIFGRPPLKIESYIDQAHVFVTHGSNSSVKAILAGVPVIALGPAITAPVAINYIDENTLESPFFPSETSLYEWLYALTHCQWTQEEIAEGLAWSHLRNTVIQ